MTELPSVLREEHIVHLEGVPSSIRQTTPCERAGKNTESRYLACRGLNFLFPYGASCLLGLDVNISEASRLLLPLLGIRVPPYDKALDWIQFAYTED